MKKKLLLLGVSICFSLSVLVNFGVLNSDTEDIDLTLLNVEALASGEGSGDCLIASCNWYEGSRCDYMCRGVEWTASNMKKK